MAQRQGHTTRPDRSKGARRGVNPGEEGTDEVRTILQEMGYEVEGEPMEDEQQGSNEHMDEDGVEMATTSKGVAHLEKLIKALECEPNDEELLAEVRSQIRQLYISNGGLPFNTANPLPQDLNVLSARDLGNILQNMMIFSVRSKSATFLDRFLNVCSNIVGITSKMSGVNIEGGIVKEIASDDLLKECAVQTFLGGISKVNPLVGLVVCSASHLSNIGLAYLNGIERQSRPTQRPITPASSSSASSSTAVVTRVTI
jgi:hypothetical protein